LQVTAIDLDTGNNARLTYRLAGNNQELKNNVTSSNVENLSDLFGIFPNSGWIYLRGTLDRETRDQYELTVLASDNGTPSATATAKVYVNIMDANDNDPTFLKSSYEFTIEENMRRGAVVGIIQAKDADLDTNAAIRYHLIPSNTSFQINPVSGEY
jgi:protocadherin-16/23